jgi:hypothetical protein
LERVWRERREREEMVRRGKREKFSIIRGVF